MLKRFSLFLLIILTGVLYFSFLGSIDLWNPDEPRYVEVAREMIALKNYIIPHLNGEIYGHKPPLFFWAIAFMFKIFHSQSEWVARLVPALSGFLIVILTFFYAKSIFKDFKVGLFSSFVLSTTVSMVHLSRRCNIDTFFSLFILISIIFLHSYINNNKKTFLFISIFFQGIATLIKGPLGFLIPFFTYFGYLFFTNDRKKLKETPWLISFIILILTILLWFIPAYISGGKEFIETIILKHVLKRYAEGVNHPRSFFYYFYIFPLDFMPWTFFLPVAFIKGIFNSNKKIDKKIIWFLCWFFIPFIFLCFSTEKRGLYLLPIYPAISIILGYSFSKFNFTNEKLFEIPYTILIFLLGILSLGIEIFYFIKIKNINPVLTVITAICFWVAVFFFHYRKKINFKIKILSIYFVTVLLLFSIYGYIFPIFNNIKSPKVFLKKLKIQNYNNVVFYGYLHPGFNFYLKKNHLNLIKELNQLKKVVESQYPDFIILKEKEFKKYENKFKEILKNYKIIKKERLGHRKLIIFKRNKS